MLVRKAAIVCLGAFALVLAAASPAHATHVYDAANADFGVTSEVIEAVGAQRTVRLTVTNHGPAEAYAGDPYAGFNTTIFMEFTMMGATLLSTSRPCEDNPFNEGADVDRRCSIGRSLAAGASRSVDVRVSVTDPDGYFNGGVSMQASYCDFQCRNATWDHNFNNQSSLLRWFIPEVSVSNAVPRGEGGTALRFNVTLSGPSDRTVKVNYSTVNGTASAPGDYTAKSGTLTFAAGQTTKTLLVTTNEDALDEANETLRLQLSNPNPVAATIVDRSGVATILDDDPPPAISASNAVPREEGGTALRFYVRLATPSGRTVKVDYATADGTATAPGDYTANSGTLVFLPGQTTKSLFVTSTEDELDEANETFWLELSNPVAATITDRSGVASILDNDP